MPMQTYPHVHVYLLVHAYMHVHTHHTTGVTTSSSGKDVKAICNIDILGFDSGRAECG